jgi:hypothetical protein
MKRLIQITVLVFTLFSQNVSHVNSFNLLDDSKLDEVVIAWEIESQDSLAGGSYMMNYRIGKQSGKSSDLYKLSSKTGTTVIAIGFNDGVDDIGMIVHGEAEDIDMRIQGDLIWLGKQDLRKSYNFIKELAAKSSRNTNLYGLLTRHGFHKESFELLKKKYYANNDVKMQKKFAFYISSIQDEMVIPFLDEIYMKSSNEKLRKQIIFAFYNNKTEKSLKRLLFIAKHDSDIDLRKKALFWIGQRAGKEMEKYFSDIVFSNDEMEIKKSAVFALYNMKNETMLKRIVNESKDIRLRKKALFWLGQLGADVDYFESILSKN